eukprot:403348582
MISSSFYQVPQCAICLLDLTQNLCVTKCGHVFHQICIQQAVESRSQCPLCRKVQTHENILSIKFGINVCESQEVKELFGQMTDDDKKQILVWQRKLIETTEEKSKLTAQVAGLSHQKIDLEKELETYKIDNKNQKEELKRQRNIISANETKIIMKDYYVDELKKERSALQKEKENLLKEIQEMRLTSEIFDQIEKSHSKTSVIQHIKTKNDMIEEEKVRLLYQHAMILISSEEQLKENIGKLKKEMIGKNQSYDLLKLEADDYKRSYDKLKKKYQETVKNGQIAKRNENDVTTSSDASNKPQLYDINKMLKQQKPQGTSFAQQQIGKSRVEAGVVTTSESLQYNTKRRKFNEISNTAATFNNKDSDLFVCSQDDDASQSGQNSVSSLTIINTDSQPSIKNINKFDGMISSQIVQTQKQQLIDDKSDVELLSLQNEQPKFKKPNQLTNGFKSGIFQSFKDGINAEKFKKQFTQQRFNDRQNKTQNGVQLGMSGFINK